MNDNCIHVLSRAVIVEDNHLLLAYDPRPNPSHYYELNVPFYYLPGGHIDFKEPAHHAIVRELKEETGYEAEVQHFLGILEHAWSFPGDELCCHTHEVNFIFKARIPAIISHTVLAQQEEHVAFSWAPLHQISEIDLRPTALKTLIPQWLKHPVENHLHSAFL